MVHGLCVLFVASGAAPVFQDKFEAGWGMPFAIAALALSPILFFSSLAALFKAGKGTQV